jgi:hypothetical protein
MTSCAAAVTGSWVPLFPYASLATGTVANGTLIVTRFVSPQAYDTVQMETTTNTTSSYQIGVWADTATGPGALLTQTAVISGVGTGVKTAALAVPTGPCWIGIQNVGGTGSATLRAVGNGGNPLLPGTDAPTVTLHHAWFRTGMGGTLPNPFGAPINKGTGFMPALYLRAV